MEDDRNDIAQKLRDDINKAIDEIHNKPQVYDSYDKVAVVVLDALMDFQEQYGAFMRTDIEGLAKMTREARDKVRIEEKAAEYASKDKPDHKSAPDVKDISEELQILEYIELNKRPLTEGERNRQNELNIDEAALKDIGTKLQARQVEERAEMVKHQHAEVNEIGQTSELYVLHFHERTDQTLRFQKERERHVNDYYSAKRLKDELQQDEQKQTLDPDKKLTR